MMRYGEPSPGRCVRQNQIQENHIQGCAPGRTRSKRTRSSSPPHKRTFQPPLTAVDESIGFSQNQQLPHFDLDPADVPKTPGLYLIQSDDKPLYVNATADLRAQLLHHRDCGGQMLIPDWLSAARGSPTGLSFVALLGAGTDRLKEARIRQVVTLQPWLNLLDLPGAA